MTTGIGTTRCSKATTKTRRVPACVCVWEAKEEIKGFLPKPGLENKNFIEHERGGEGLLAQGRGSGGNQALLCGEKEGG